MTPMRSCHLVYERAVSSKSYKGAAHTLLIKATSWIEKYNNLKALVEEKDLEIEALKKKLGAIHRFTSPKE